MELIVAKSVLLLSIPLLAQGVIQQPLLTDSQFTILILMAFITTLIAPVSLRLAVPRVCAGFRPGLLPALARFLRRGCLRLPIASPTVIGHHRLTEAETVFREEPQTYLDHCWVVENPLIPGNFFHRLVYTQGRAIRAVRRWLPPHPPRPKFWPPG